MTRSKLYGTCFAPAANFRGAWVSQKPAQQSSPTYALHVCEHVSCVYVCWCRCRALNNEATLAVTLQQTTSQVSTELADLCCENHTLYCENQALMQVRLWLVWLLCAAASCGWLLCRMLFRKADVCDIDVCGCYRAVA
jgi:hypothetical protein